VYYGEEGIFDPDWVECTDGTLDDISTALPLIEALHLNNSGISGNFSSISSCTNLTELSIAEYGISGDLSSLSSLRGLKLLEIQHNEDVSASGNLSNLSHLRDLECLRITDCPDVNGSFSSLASLVALKDLSIEVGSIEGNISLLLPLVSLKNLTLSSYCPDLNGSFTSLEPLNLRHLYFPYLLVREEAKMGGGWFGAPSWVTLHTQGP
jgi:hypothetical protein